MKRKLTLAMLVILALALPTAARAAAVGDDSACPAPAVPGSSSHTWQQVSVQEPNCQHGRVETYRCSGCGKTFISASGGTGDHQFGPYEEIAPTCIGYGGTRRVCVVCGEEEREWETPPLGHSPVIIPGVEAACTAGGKTEGTRCSVCGTVLTGQQDTAPLGHSPETMPGRAPTCTERGLTEGARCSVCGTVLASQESIPAAGHAWGEWKTETVGSCAWQEIQARFCAVCGAREARYSGFGGHDWGKWTTVLAPTATESGMQERQCMIDASHREEREIPPEGQEQTAEREAEPGLLCEVRLEPDAGTGMRYGGAIVQGEHTLTNTGDCDLYLSFVNFDLFHDSITAPRAPGTGRFPGTAWPRGRHWRSTVTNTLSGPMKRTWANYPSRPSIPPSTRREGERRKPLNPIPSA